MLIAIALIIVIITASYCCNGSAASESASIARKPVCNNILTKYAHMSVRQPRIEGLSCACCAHGFSGSAGGRAQGVASWLQTHICVSYNYLHRSRLYIFPSLRLETVLISLDSHDPMIWMLMHWITNLGRQPFASSCSISDTTDSSRAWSKVLTELEGL